MAIIDTLRTSPMSPGITVLGFISLFLIYYVLDRTYRIHFGPLSRLPGPKVWAWTNLYDIVYQIQGRNHEIMKKLHDEYGPVVRIGLKEVSFTGPEAWKDIYGHKKHGQAKASRDPVYYGKGNDSIITADDANHSRIRRILSPAFSDRFMRESEPLLKKWAAKMLERLTERAQTGSETDLLKFYNCTTFDIMGDLTFSENLGMLDNSEYSPWVKSIFAGIKISTIIGCIKRIHPVISLAVSAILKSSKAVEKASREHEEYSSKRVDRRLQRNPETPDLWSKILDKSESVQTLTLKEHHNTAGIFMIAGTETTATALSGTTFHLLRNPAALSRLTLEIRSAFRSGLLDGVNLEALARLEYLSAVLREGLRMYPPVPGILPRMTPRGGMVICGNWIPGGTTVGVHQVATCRSERYWASPEEFRPERWMGGEGFEGDRLDANEPFSVGERNCIGKTLAWHEMRLLLVTVLLNFDLELCEESEGWDQQKMYGLWEKKPLMCKLKLVERTQ